MKKIIVYMIFMLMISYLNSQSSTIDEDQCNQSSSDQSSVQKAHHCNNPACPHYQKDQEAKPSDKEIQSLAISTLANMAQGLVNIGNDPHNTQNVTSSIANILGSFANLVITAMKNKNINIEELLADEEFLEECSALLLKKAHKIKKQQQA